MAEPGTKTVRENHPFGFMKAMIAANQLRVGVSWIEGFAKAQQASAEGGGYFVIEGFYRRRVRRLSDVEQRERLYSRPKDAKDD